MDGEVTTTTKTNNWSEAVEDLVEDGEFDKAISVLESVVSELETPSPSSKVDLQLSSALLDLAKLYSAKDLSLKADEARSRALLLKNRTASCERDVKNTKEDSVQCSQGPSESCDGSSNEDDWEAIADRAPEELLSPERLPEVSKLSLKDTETPKRRGRGTFAYTTNGLYSCQDAYPPTIDSPENEAQCHSPERDAQVPKLKYGTRHIVVLADFPPSTATADLEKLLRNFKDHEVVIRWVNDTTALAVFRTPSIALDACNNIKCPFTVRILEEDDVLLKSIRPRDTEPPRQRPETSVQTARRLIAQGMGIKLPSTNFGSRELRKQEEARRNRIVSRQNMKNDAWGDDDD